jgi:hypothetical protein
MKRYKSLGCDEIPAEMIKVGGEILYSEINRLNCSIWNKEELPQQWKESILVPVPIHRKGDTTNCNNCQGISLLSTDDKILSNILLDSFTIYGNEITGDQCGFPRNRFPIDQI